MVQLIMPKMGESVAEATILKWLKKEGDPIEADEPILEIATDKVDSEVPSPCAGIMSKRLFEEGQVVKVGEIIAEIAESGEKVSAAPVAAPAVVPQVAKSETAAPSSNGSPKPAVQAEVTIDKNSASVGENSMGLTAGEKLTVEELLYGLFLNSGNDAAEVLAEESPYGRDEFVFIMNKKAESLGLTNTRFSNASGLEGDGRQYSTVKDLLTLTRYALTFPEFAKIAATYEHEILVTSTHKYFLLYNQTNLLTTYPGVKGVKTGYTEEAGLCLITYLEYKGHKIVAVLLNSENRRQDMKELLDYSLKSLGVEPPAHN